MYTGIYQYAALIARASLPAAVLAETSPCHLICGDIRAGLAILLIFADEAVEAQFERGDRATQLSQPI